jgi:hypothetical protein
MKIINHIKAFFRMPLTLTEISKSHIKEIQRIEDSIKFRITDIENIYPEIVELNRKIDKIMEKIGVEKW